MSKTENTKMKRTKAQVDKKIEEIAVTIIREVDDEGLLLRHIIRGALIRFHRWLEEEG